MPNDNLGVAHGRIRIDVDDRGSAQATAALVKMQAQFEQMNKTLARIDKSLKNTDVELDRTARSMDRAGKAAKGYSSSLFDTHKSFSTFAKDSRDLVQDLQTVIVYANRAKQAFDKLATVTRFLNTSGGLSRNNNLGMGSASLVALNNMLAKTSGSIGKFNQTIRQNVYENNLWGKALRSISSDIRDNSLSMQVWSAKLALAGAGVNNVRNKLYGLGSAIDASPGWVRKLSGVVGTIAKVGTVGGVLSTALGPLAGMDNLIGTNFTKRVVGSLSKIGDKTNSIGGVFARVFGDKAGTPFGKLSNMLKNFGGDFDNFLVKGSGNVTRFKDRLDLGITSMGKWVTDSKSLISSIALLTGNITKLWQRFQWFFKIPKPLMAAFGTFFARILPTALYGVRKAMQGLSNLTAGLWDGLKQLSGGLTIIPGLIATLGAAVTSLVPVFKGLGDQFKDIFSDDPIAAMAAWIKLPDHLKPMGQAIKNLVPKWKELQKSLQTEAFRGIEKQIDALASVYFPLFERNALSVVAAFRRIKDAAVGFALDVNTQKDFSTIYQNTAASLNQIAGATKPVLQGFRDMATVGTGFLKDATAWAPYLSQKFRDWAELNRDNGQMMRWMQDARSGAYDLAKGFKELVKSAYNLLTLFKTNSGGEFLDRFANAMGRLDKWTKESNIDGKLASIRRSLSNLGENNIQDVNNLLRIFGKTVESFIPMLNKLSNAFSWVFVRGLGTALKVIDATISAFQSLGLASPVGILLGVVAAARLLPKWFASSKEAILAFVGAIQLLKNKGKIFGGIETGALHVSEILDKFGEKGKKVGDGLLNLSNSATKSGAKIINFAGVLGGIGSAALVFYDLYNSATEHIDQFNAKLDESKQHLLDFRDNIQNAFAEDRGLKGKNVMSSISEGLNNMYQDTANQAVNTVSMWKHVQDKVKETVDFMTGKNGAAERHDTVFGAMFGGDSQELDNIQTTIEKAQLANKKLKELREAGVNLEGVLGSTDAGFKAFIDDLRKSGDEGNLAADKLEELRRTISAAEADARRAGEANLALSDGIHRIAKAGGDAATALDGLKIALEALGILKTSAVEKTIAYEKSLQDLKDTFTELANEAGGANAALTAAGDLDLKSAAGQKLAEALIKVGDTYLAQAVATKDAVGSYKSLEAALADVAAQTGIPIEKLKALEAQFGGTPKEVQFLIDLVGTDAAGEDMAAFILKVQQMTKNGIVIPAELNPQVKAEDISKQINEAVGKAYGSGAVEVTSVRGGNLVIAPNLDDKQLQAVIDELAKHNINVKGGEANPAKLPVDITTNFDEDSLRKALETMQGHLATAAQDAELKGLSLGKNFAEGIRKASSDVQRAALLLAFQASRPLPGSPAKIGPLSGKGWSKIRGQSLGSDFASGIASGKPAVGAAALEVAGAVGEGLKNTGAYQTGQFLGQLSQLNGFFANLVQTFSDVAQAAMGIAKFVSDPMGKGTFFGKNMGFRRDPGVTDAMRQQRQADEAQSRLTSFYGSRQYPQGNMDAYGMPMIQGPGKLQRDAAQGDVQAAIVAEGQRRGLTKQQIEAAMAIAGHESNYNQNNFGAGQGAFLPGGGKGNAYGLYQQTPEGGWGSVDQLMDPNYAIGKFFDAFQKALQSNADPLAAAVLTQNPQLAGTNLAAQDYFKKTQAALPEAMKAVESALASGSILPSQSGGVMPGVGNFPVIAPSSKLEDANGRHSQSAAAQVSGLMDSIFGSMINSIGGARNDDKPWHPSGRALDIGIGEVNAANQAKGDIMNAWLRQNAEALGLQDTIWRDTWRDFSGNSSTVAGHQNHIHVTFKDGAVLNIGPNGSKLTMPTAGAAMFGGALGSFVPGAKQPTVGPPPIPEDPAKVAPRDLVTINPDGTFTPVHVGDGATPGPDQPINAATGKPWTPEEAAAYWAKPENAPQYDRSQLKPGDLNTPGIFQGTQEEQLKQLEAQTPLLQGILTGTADLATLTESQAISIANELQNQIDYQTALDTPASRQAASAMGGALSSITDQFGLAANASPIDTAAQIADSVATIASDVFAVIGSTIEAVGAGKNMADTLVRGIANTEDIYNMVDHVQTFIKLGADIAGAVSSITSAIGSIAGASGGMDMGASAAIQGISQVASMVQAGLEAANAVIDLGQEAYRIIGSYVGDFMGYLVGGVGGQLAGNVKYLLDEKTNELLAYSVDNPGDKRGHNLAFQYTDPSARNQQIGQINVYGGPGQDPRDNTRQMMFQVRASQFAAATGQ